MNVLVLLESARERRDAEQQLRWLGLHCLVAKTSEAALALFQSDIHHLIFDASMRDDGRAGVAFLKQVRGALKSRLPAITLAETLDEAVRRESENLGARYLVKPGLPMVGLVAYLRRNAVGPVARGSGKFEIVRRELYDLALMEAKGNLTNAGKLLGVSRQAVQRHLRLK